MLLNIQRRICSMAISSTAPLRWDGSQPFIPRALGRCPAEIFTHENRGKAARLDRSWRDEVAPPGHPFRPLHSDRILFDGQPIALVRTS
jgi:hypothetical protein